MSCSMFPPSVDLPDGPTTDCRNLAPAEIRYHNWLLLISKGQNTGRQVFGDVRKRLTTKLVVETHTCLASDAAMQCRRGTLQILDSAGHIYPAMRGTCSTNMQHSAVLSVLLSVLLKKKVVLFFFIFIVLISLRLISFM